jgi:hypothetical protein
MVSILPMFNPCPDWQPAPGDIGAVSHPPLAFLFSAHEMNLLIALNTARSSAAPQPHYHWPSEYQLTVPAAFCPPWMRGTRRGSKGLKG